MAKLTLTGTGKFKRLCSLLRMESRAHVVGHLEELWNAAHARKSAIVGDFDEVEGAADWPSSRPRHQFAQALATVGFLDEIVPGRVYAIHDYYDHAPKYIKDHLTRAAREDVTVGPATYWLGIEAFSRLFEDHDAPVPGEIREAFEGEADAPEAPSSEEDEEEKASRGGSSSTLDALRRSEEGASTPFGAKKGALSSQVQSKSYTSPPSSPPPPPPPPSQEGCGAPPEVRAAIAEVAAAISRLETTPGAEAIAGELERRALTAKSPFEWEGLWADAARALADHAPKAPSLEVTS